jgi:hypothetical protein
LITGFQKRFRRSRRRARPVAFAVMMLVCLALLILLTVVQVAHVHAAASDSDRCPLCMVLHTAAPVAVTAAVIMLVQVAAAAPVLRVRAVSRHWHPQLFTRPPPAAC